MNVTALSTSPFQMISSIKENCPPLTAWFRSFKSGVCLTGNPSDIWTSSAYPLYNERSPLRNQRLPDGNPKPPFDGLNRASPHLKALENFPWQESPITTSYTLFCRSGSDFSSLHSLFQRVARTLLITSGPAILYAANWPQIVRKNMASLNNDSKKTKAWIKNRRR
jgi:hypothetical protein